MGSPAVWQARSFSRNGTPRNGPSAGSVASAFSNSGWITAFSSPLSASMRSMAASVSSRGRDLPGADELGLGGGIQSEVQAVLSARSKGRESRLGFGTFPDDGTVSAPTEAQGQGKGSLDNPEVHENVPGHIIPILEREFDDFDNEAEQVPRGRHPPRTSSSASA